MQHKFDEEELKLTVFLSGEIDHHRAVKVRSDIDSLIDEKRPKLLVMELSGIGFCDSSGLGLIMGRYKKMTSAGGSVILLDAPDEVIRIITLAGMDKLIKTERSEKKCQGSVR